MTVACDCAHQILRMAPRKAATQTASTPSMQYWQTLCPQPLYFVNDGAKISNGPYTYTDIGQYFCRFLTLKFALNQFLSS